MLRFSIVYIFTIITFTCNTGFAQNFSVYSDKFDNGSPSGIMGASNGKSLKIEPTCAENPFKGSNCLKVSSDGSEAWSGVFVQQGNDWKDNIDKSIPLANLNDYRYLVFYARADKDFNIAKVGMGEGSDGPKEEGGVPLTKEWKRFVMELNKTDRSRVNGTFLIVFESAGTVYFDDIYYAKEGFAIENSDVVYAERKEPLDPTSYYVFADKWEHGVPSGFMGEKNGESMKILDSHRENPYLGTKCVKITTNKAETWRGIYIHYTGSWNQSLDETTKLPNLSEYDKLEFYARAEPYPGDEVYILKEVGVGAGDASEGQRTDTFLEIGPKWKKYTINLKGTKLDRVNSLLFLVLPEGTLYLDEIRFTKKVK